MFQELNNAEYTHIYVHVCVYIKYGSRCRTNTESSPKTEGHQTHSRVVDVCSCSGDGSHHRHRHCHHHHHHLQKEQEQEQRDQNQRTTDDDWQQSFPNLISSYSRVCVELTNGTKAPRSLELWGEGRHPSPSNHVDDPHLHPPTQPLKNLRPKKYSSGGGYPIAMLAMDSMVGGPRIEDWQDSVILMKIGKCSSLRLAPVPAPILLLWPAH